ncbi:MAG: cytochrome P450 [Ktedonobacterales bacterium]
MPNSHLPPGPAGFPVVGNVFQFRRDPLTFVSGVQRSFGRMATIYLGGTPIVMFFRPEHVRYFLVEQARNFTSSQFNQNLRRVLGDGLLTTDGDFHRQQRRLIQPAFHKRRVESYASIMVQHTQEMLDQEWRPGARVDVAQAMRDLTLRIVAKSLFDVDLKEDHPELGASFTSVIENPVRLPFSVRALPIDLPFTAYGKHMDGLRTLNAYVYQLIERRRAEGRDTGDVLSMLLSAQEDGVTMTDRQIRDQTMTLFAAGHETTANALAWTFYLLSEHPVVSAKLAAELHTVLRGRPSSVDDLPNLPYLDWVVSESMRLYPPAWTQGRRGIDAFELEGYHFPGGTTVMFSQWVLHRLPDIWGDPDAFRPERWDPLNEQKVPAGAYFPFGAGPRMCIGMPFAQLEARLLLATILQRYSPRLVPGYPVQPRPRVTLRPKYGIQMTLEPAAESVRHAVTVMRG